MAKLINTAKIEQALVVAFSQWATEDVNDTHWREQFTEVKWKYEREGREEKTRRGNPSAPIRDAGNPRDIYDFGLLYQSGVDSFTLVANAAIVNASWHWDAKNSSGREYASYVHNGTGTNRTARPFTDDISIPSSFFAKKPGMALKNRIADALSRL